jgi:hypothetical protein
MFDEEFMEDCIEESPHTFLGADLEVVERQLILGGFRPDLICKFNNELWIVEIQQRALDRAHLYKCLEYRDLLKGDKKADVVRVLVVCNSIDERYLPLAKAHEVEIIAIDRDKFIDLASQFCPRSTAKLIKRRDIENVTKPRSMTVYDFRPLGWSEHLSIFDVMEHIHRECGRNNLKLGDLRKERYWSVMYEIENLICRDWKQSIGKIVDPENWDVDRLVSKPKRWQPEAVKDVTRIRKPAIEICAFITSKDNLSIIWYPKAADRQGLYRVGDWAYWPGDGTYGWTRPSNELVFIRDVDRLCPGSNAHRIDQAFCNWDVVDELFVALIKLAYDWLCETLSSITQVEKISDFEFELADPSPDDFRRG